jgi:magnesium-transporting ATPase (P-type)
MNGAILAAVIMGVYIFSLQHFCDGAVNQSEILKVDNFEENLAKARTVAFISLVYSENIRAYIARSFDKPFWVNLCGNKEMLKAVVLAQLALYIAVLVPGVSDKILGLRGLDIGLWGWAVSLIGPVATVIFCELAKIITHFQVRQYQAKLMKKRNLEQEQIHKEDASELPTLMKQPSDPAIRKNEEAAV